jgi:transcriptional regulator with XRE-family HTH domain
MDLETTPWLTKSDLAREIDASKNNISKLERSKRLWRGWLIQRRKVEKLRKLYINQDWEYRALKISMWNPKTASTEVQIPEDWFQPLAKFKNAYVMLNTIRDLEDDLSQLASAMDMQQTLYKERKEALQTVQQTVRTLYKHPLAEQLGLTSSDELLALFQDTTLVPVFASKEQPAEESSPEVPAPLHTFQKALIVGGVPKPDVRKQIADFLDIPEVEWPEFKKHNLASANSYAERVKNSQYDVVFLIAQFCRHKFFYQFRDACKETKTPFVRLDRGYNPVQFELALKHHLTDEVHAHG